MRYIYTGKYTIRVQEIDHNKRVQIPELVRIMQDASMQHTLQLKASVWDLEAEKLSWVLVKKHFRFFRLPGWGTEIIVETYTSGMDKVLTFRDYIVRDAQGNLLAQASSAWLLMHTEQRKIMRIPERFIPIISDDTDALPRPFDKIIIPDHPPVISRDYRISYFHLDWNGHSNNVHILRFVLETMPDELLFHYRLCEMGIYFKQESVLHDELEVQSIRDENSPLQYFHKVVRKKDFMPVATAFTSWEKYPG
ncbi:MAG: hypothetical protein IPM26_09505 [Saprospiraceae bacterium]|nr:hypothetical protein [Saprospiraceae bacterium]